MPSLIHACAALPMPYVTPTAMGTCTNGSGTSAAAVEPARMPANDITKPLTAEVEGFELYTSPIRTTVYTWFAINEKLPTIGINTITPARAAPQRQTASASSSNTACSVMGGRDGITDGSHRPSAP